jgi:hypothetical protein
VLARYQRREPVINQALKEVFLWESLPAKSGRALATLVQDSVSAATVSAVAKALENLTIASGSSLRVTHQPQSPRIFTRTGTISSTTTPLNRAPCRLPTFVSITETPAPDGVFGTDDDVQPAADIEQEGVQVACQQSVPGSAVALFVMG